MLRFPFVIACFCFVLLVVWSFTYQDLVENYSFSEMKHFPQMPVPEDNRITIEGVKLGRHLFYDKILSADRSVACASCHKQEFAFSDSPNKFSKGIDDQIQERNTLPLFNLAWYDAMFWDGKANSIEEQVFHPVKAHNEMNLKWTEAVERIRRSDTYPDLFFEAFGNIEIDSIHVSKAIAQFERTLLSHNSRFDKALRGELKLNSDEYAGLVLMNEQNKGNCLHCHTSDADALGTTGRFSNNGLDEVSEISGFKDLGRGNITGNEMNNGQFKIPSIRNLVFTAPYMHDGRFETLEEVLQFYNEGIKRSPTIDTKMTTVHQGGAKLTDDEQKKIISFLLALTDSTFIQDERYSNPFQN